MSSAAGARALPALRQDLRLIDAGRRLGGARRWLIHDPLQGRFFAIDGKIRLMLGLWQAGVTGNDLIERAWARHSEVVAAAEVEALAGFLASHGLVVAEAGGWRDIAQRAARRRASPGARLLDGYLFFRMPLLRPEPFLARTIRYVRPLGTPASGLAIAALGVAGLYLVSREWEVFLATLADAVSIEGGLLLAAAMLLLKLAHELGHAYVAHHYGCRVPVIGVAFMLGVPLLYCDVSDATRLASARQRMAIAGAGVLVDLAVAALATFVWAFLPPGPMRSVAFSLATAGWLLSLAINLNPFMKLDGYHMLVDATGLDNLHDRAMALARWRLRETLFGLAHPAPEVLPSGVAAWLAVFGFATWVYRLVLFTGIALAVYALFFKLAGVALFLVEIAYFVARPVWWELREWYTMRSEILASARSLVTGGVVATALALLVMPWSTTVVVPAVLEAGPVVPLFAGAAGRIEAVRVSRGDVVRAGAPLIELSAPALAQELALTERKAALVELRRARRAGDDIDRGEAAVLEQEAQALAARRSGLLQQQRELVLTAPADGIVAEMAGSLDAGRWVGRKEPLLTLRLMSGPRIRGYLEAADVWRIGTGARGRFVPDDLSIAAVPARIASIASAGTPVIDQIELAASFGGRLADRLDAQRRPVPAMAQFAVRAEVEGPVEAAMTVRTVAGVLLVEGARESLASRLWRQVLKVLVRESGV